MNLGAVLSKIQMGSQFRKEITVANVVFELGVLTFDEEQRTDSIANAEGMDFSVFLNKTRQQILSYAIRKIDGEEIPDVVHLEDGGTQEKPLYLRDMISKMPIKVVDQLYDAYVDLKDESDESLERSMKYNWHKTPEQRENERKEKEEEAKQEALESEKKKEDEEKIEFKKVEEDKNPVTKNE